MPLTDRPFQGHRCADLHTQDQCPFFRVLLELRNRIYEDLLYVPTESKCITIVHERETSGAHSVLRLLLTCRQIMQEAEGIFYNLNELYFDIGLIDLPNFHRFLSVFSPGRRNFVKRINLDLATIESVASVLRLLERFSAIEAVTLGFPRGHDCLQEGLLMRKLKPDAPAIKAKRLRLCRHLSGSKSPSCALNTGDSIRWSDGEVGILSSNATAVGEGLR